MFYLVHYTVDKLCSETGCKRVAIYDYHANNLCRECLDYYLGFAQYLNSSINITGRKILTSGM